MGVTMRVHVATLVASLITSSLALATPSKHVLHEKRTAALKRWAKREEVPSTAVLPMRIGLVQSNIDNGVGASLLDRMYAFSLQLSIYEASRLNNKQISP